MNWGTRILRFALLALLLTTANPAAAEVTDDTISARVVVKLDHGAAAVAVARGIGGSIERRITARTISMSVPGAVTEDVVAELERRSEVLWAEPDRRYVASREPNDPCYVSGCAGGTQWNLRKVRAPEAWNVTTGDPIKVALIDSGVDTAHPDFRGRVTVGPNFSTDPSNDDDYGHGTHVAGILGATANNSSGIAGVSWAASLVSIKALDGNGLGSASSIATSLYWAADNGARIANLSLGGEYSRVMAEAVAYAQARGVLVVAAADNQGSPVPIYPAALPDVIAVGASDEDDRIAAFSNRGPWVDIVAPGTEILSAWPTQLSGSSPYEVVSGTSMASPQVAGAAALIWSAYPYLSGSGVQARLVDSARLITGSGTLVASGRLDIAAALTNVASGYRFAASDGGVFSYGLRFLGSTGGGSLSRPVVAMVTPGRPDGYWLIAADGGVFTFGNVGFYGSTGALQLNRPIVAGAATRSGLGYWLVASDGGVFSYGDARFYGSTGGTRLNAPIVSLVPTATGGGYWLVAADGGIFSFGDAVFRGSAGNVALARPIVGAARSHSGNGYWLVASDGGVFSYGDATFYGSAGTLPLKSSVVAVTPSATGFGYWLVAADGGVFTFGDAKFLGSTGATPLARPIVSAT